MSDKPVYLSDIFGEDVFNDTRYYRNTLSKAYINRMLEENAIPVIWTTNNIESMDKAFLRRFTYSVKFEELDEELDELFELIFLVFIFVCLIFI